MSKVKAELVHTHNPFSFGQQLQVEPEDDQINDPIEETQEDDVDNGAVPSPERKAAVGYVSNNGYEEDEDYEEEEVDEEDDDSLEPDTEDVDIDQVEAVSSLSTAFKTLGFIDDTEKFKDVKSVSDFLVAYEKTKADQLYETIKEELAQTYSEEAIRSIDFIMNGGSPEDLSAYSSIERLPIEGKENEENIKALILAMHKDRGLDDKRALVLYSKAYDEGEDYEEAKEAKAYFAEKRKAHEEGLARARKEEEQAIARQKQENINGLKQLIKTRKIGEEQLTEKEANELEQYMFSQTNLADVFDEMSNKNVKAKVSQYFIDYNNFMKQPDALLKLARFIKNNGNTSISKEKVKEEVNRDLLIQLNGFGVKGSNNRQKKKNAFLT